MKSLQPVNQNVLLELDHEKDLKQTKSGIFLPDAAVEKQNFAKVAGISTIENPEIAIGDTVLYKAFSGTEIEIEGKKYLLLPYADILAKVVETEAI